MSHKWIGIQQAPVNSLTVNFFYGVVKLIVFFPRNLWVFIILYLYICSNISAYSRWHIGTSRKDIQKSLFPLSHHTILLIQYYTFWSSLTHHNHPAKSINYWINKHSVCLDWTILSSTNHNVHISNCLQICIKIINKFNCKSHLQPAKITLRINIIILSWQCINTAQNVWRWWWGWRAVLMDELRDARNKDY